MGAGRTRARVASSTSETISAPRPSASGDVGARVAQGHDRAAREAEARRREAARAEADHRHPLALQIDHVAT
jgi:hypothetical protein